MKNSVSWALVIAASLAVLAGGVAQAMPAAVSQSPHDMLASTDRYASWVVDTCVRTGGFATAGAGEYVSIDGEGVPAIIFPKAGVPNDAQVSEAVNELVRTVAPEPCCICGIYDPVSGGLKGCAALATPCCCLATLKTDGQINCSCQGGKACGT